MTDVEEFLAHHGVKGMHWGIRNKRGKNGRVSTEAKNAARVHEKLKTHGVKSLTNKELADLNKRMNLETQTNKLNPGKIQKGTKAAAEILAVGATVNQAISFAKSPAGQAIKKSLSK